MYVTIISPEQIIYKGEAVSLTVPGTKGRFQMLENHAPIVSMLEKGIVRIELSDKQKKEFLSKKSSILSFNDDKNEVLLEIESGTLEFKNNRAVVLMG